MNIIISVNLKKDHIGNALYTLLCGVIIMKKIKVEVEKYEATDGRVFDELEECELYEKRLNGKVKTCDSCRGEGKVDPYGDGRTFNTCGKCKGKGWLELREVWS